MKKYFLIILTIIIVSSCKNSTKTIKLNDNLFAKGKNISDSIFNGEVKYYDSMDRLLYKTNFINNKLDGSSILYNSKGTVIDSIFYVNGFANGFHYQFDDEGNLTYLDYSYFGLGVGPKVYYMNKQLKNFTFSNFDNQVLFAAEYDDKGINEHSGYPLNFNYYSANLDGGKKIGLKLYLIEPPLVYIKYHLGIINLRDNSKKEISILNRNKVFIDTLIPSLDKDHEYYLQADYIDSISRNDKEYYFQKIKDSLPTHLTGF